MEEFRALIRQIGEHPIIVRSSSYLEDSFGLAFSGKYQSIFLANQGDEESRLAAFIRGVKTCSPACTVRTPSSTAGTTAFWTSTSAWP